MKTRPRFYAFTRPAQRINRNHNKLLTSKPPTAKLGTMRKALFLLGGLLLMAPSLCGGATITGVTGTAQAKDESGAWKAISFGSEIPNGATVRTAPNSSVDVLLITGVVVQLLDDAQATLTISGASTRILLINGKSQIKVN